jgi:hypothetical protein
MALMGVLPVRLRLRPDLAFVHSALFMMDAFVLSECEIPPGDVETPDRA